MTDTIREEDSAEAIDEEPSTKRAKIDADSNAVSTLASLASAATTTTTNGALVKGEKKEGDVEGAAADDQSGGEAEGAKNMTDEAMEGGESIALSQSERKRYREKQRRQNISAAIDALTKVLLKTDPSNFIEHNNQVYFAAEKAPTPLNDANDSTFRKRRTSSSTSHHHQPLNRTEVISHATILIEKIASENADLKMKFMQMPHLNVASGAVVDSGENATAASGTSTEASKQGNGSATAPGVPTQFSYPGQPQMILMPGTPYPFPGYVVNGQPVPMQWSMQPHPAFMSPTGMPPSQGDASEEGKDKDKETSADSEKKEGEKGEEEKGEEEKGEKDPQSKGSDETKSTKEKDANEATV